VKFIKLERGRYCFEIAEKQKALLFTVLRLYPATSPGRQQLSKSGAGGDAQELLETALAEERSANIKAVAAMIESNSRFRKTESGWQFSLSAAQIECLLKVLNDVRIGCWVAMGSPDGQDEILAALSKDKLRNSPRLWAMEMCGHFEMVLLKALERA
jgi:hypothetical protein